MSSAAGTGVRSHSTRMTTTMMAITRAAMAIVRVSMARLLRRGLGSKLPRLLDRKQGLQGYPVRSLQPGVVEATSGITRYYRSNWWSAVIGYRSEPSCGDQVGLVDRVYFLRSVSVNRASASPRFLAPSIANDPIADGGAAADAWPCADATDRSDHSVEDADLVRLEHVLVWSMDDTLRIGAHNGHLMVAALKRHQDRPVIHLGDVTLTGGQVAERISQYVQAFESLGAGTGAPGRAARPQPPGGAVHPRRRPDPGLPADVAAPARLGRRPRLRDQRRRHQHPHHRPVLRGPRARAARQVPRPQAGADDRAGAGVARRGGLRPDGRRRDVRPGAPRRRACCRPTTSSPSSTPAVRRASRRA